MNSFLHQKWWVMRVMRQVYLRYTGASVEISEWRQGGIFPVWITRGSSQTTRHLLIRKISWECCSTASSPLRPSKF